MVKKVQAEIEQQELAADNLFKEIRKLAGVTSVSEAAKKRQRRDVMQGVRQARTEVLAIAITGRCCSKTYLIKRIFILFLEAKILHPLLVITFQTFFSAMNGYQKRIRNFFV